MDTVFDLLDELFGDNLILSLLVFLATSTVAFGIMATIRVRRGVRRRAAGVLAGEDRAGSDSMRYASQKAAARLMDYATRHFSGSETDNQRELKRRLVQAGFRAGTLSIIPVFAGPHLSFLTDLLGVTLSTVRQIHRSISFLPPLGVMAWRHHTILSHSFSPVNL